MSNQAATILVIDDENSVLEVVRAYLERGGYHVYATPDGKEARKLFYSVSPDLVVLDLLLPGVSGLDLCREFRQATSVPIIMLTALTDEVDRILGLRLGADDYITKPFSPRELVARVEAVLRRYQGGSTANSHGTVRRFGPLCIDVEKYQVTLDGEPVELTPTEFRLLESLSSQPGRVFSRLQMVERIQGHTYEGYERTIDSHIKNLRRKLDDDPLNPSFIATVYGVGYKFQYRQEE